MAPKTAFAYCHLQVWQKTQMHKSHGITEESCLFQYFKPQLGVNNHKKKWPKTQKINITQSF